MPEIDFSFLAIIFFFPRYFWSMNFLPEEEGTFVKNVNQIAGKGNEHDLTFVIELPTGQWILRLPPFNWYLIYAPSLIGKQKSISTSESVKRKHFSGFSFFSCFLGKFFFFFSDFLLRGERMCTWIYFLLRHRMHMFFRSSSLSVINVIQIPSKNFKNWENESVVKKHQTRVRSQNGKI